MKGKGKETKIVQCAICKAIAGLTAYIKVEAGYVELIKHLIIRSYLAVISSTLLSRRIMAVAVFLISFPNLRFYHLRLSGPTIIIIQVALTSRTEVVVNSVIERLVREAPDDFMNGVAVAQ